MWQQLKNIYHLFQGISANFINGYPSKKLHVIGITGTDGKTTTTALVYHILRSAGLKTSVISTVYAQIGDEVHDTGLHVTTPSSFAVQSLLKKAVDQGEEYFVMETTSHSLDQYRVYGVEYEIGVITNVSHEHLDYHKTYENYVKTKAILLQSAKKPIVNIDDQSFDHLKQYLPEGYLSYGLKNKATYNFDVTKKIERNLADFNKYNYLAAYAVCNLLGISDQKIFSAMKTYHLPPGRMEIVYNKKFTVIVDFAHTPKAIDEALKAIRARNKGGIIHIFGSAAKRDTAKRPLMGESSGKHADLTIITEEDYRDEDPVKIAEEVAVGIKKQRFTFVEPDNFGRKFKQYTIITDRAQAIKKALEIVRPGDVIVLTGKGHEKSLARGNVEFPWNDREQVFKQMEKFGKAL